jgi:hypothetical protein
MRTLEKLLRILFIINLIVFGASFFFRNTLPDLDPIPPEITKEPYQSEVVADKIIIENDGYTAELEPLFDYRITGLVVTTHNSDSWHDVTHKNDPFNTRDLCVVWGENVTTGAYKTGKFTSGDFNLFLEF